MDGNLVEVEVLLKPAGAGRAETTDTVSSRKPNPGDIERSRRWFAARGLNAYATEFGVVCSGPKALVEEVFRTKLMGGCGGSGMPVFQAKASLTPPDELAELIDSITLPGRPEFFP